MEWKRRFNHERWSSYESLMKILFNNKRAYLEKEVFMNRSSGNRIKHHFLMILRPSQVPATPSQSKPPNKISLVYQRLNMKSELVMTCLKQTDFWVTDGADVLFPEWPSV